MRSIAALLLGGICLVSILLLMPAGLGARLRRHRMFRSGFNRAGIGMAIVNRAGKIEAVNPVLSRLLGTNQAELVGRPFDNFIVEGTGGQLDTLETGPQEIRYARPDGAFWGRTTVSSVSDGPGNGSVQVWQIEDVSEARRVRELLDRAHSELRFKAKQLERTNKDLEQFASIASHDLSEPLRMVSGFVELLGSRYRGRLDEEADQYIAFAVEGAERMRRMIDDLVAYARAGREERTVAPVDVQAVVRQTVHALRHQVEATGATITFADLPTVWGEPGQLTQLFQNLIANSLKFVGEQKPDIQVSGRATDDGYEFAVADNGIGIDQRDRERVFLPFKRLHARSEYPGNGIGLAVCCRIVERAGGSIWIDEPDGTGTTVRFVLPDRAYEGRDYATA